MGVPAGAGVHRRAVGADRPVRLSDRDAVVLPHQGEHLQHPHRQRRPDAGFGGADLRGPLGRLRPVGGSDVGRRRAGRLRGDARQPAGRGLGSDRARARRGGRGWRQRGADRQVQAQLLRRHAGDDGAHLRRSGRDHQRPDRGDLLAGVLLRHRQQQPRRGAGADLDLLGGDRDRRAGAQPHLLRPRGVRGRRQPRGRSAGGDQRHAGADPRLRGRRVRRRAGRDRGRQPALLGRAVLRLDADADRGRRRAARRDQLLRRHRRRGGHGRRRAADRGVAERPRPDGGLLVLAAGRHRRGPDRGGGAGPDSDALPALMARLGIDVGGTFVELVLADPARLLDSITAGVEAVLTRAGVAGAEVDQVLHATTRGSNLVLERAGPRTALVTTRGFRDVLQIQRALRWSMYDVQLSKPEPLVPRSLSFEVTERTLADGSVLVPLDEHELLEVAGRLRAARVEAVAVAFLHSYANPSHERAATSLLARELPGVLICASSELSLQAREYERANTAVVNAYIAAAVSEYLERLERSLAALDVRAPVWVMQSSGGLASVADVLARPVRTLESGPAAGVIGAAAFGKALGHQNLISFDMGGTTAKVAVVAEGVPARADYFELQRVGNRRGSGLPVDIPALDLVEIGTGGGSVAEVREATLRVGPRSAGADPGPACYGRGGTEPTVTDANLLLGYYDPTVFAGGLVLDREAARAAIERLALELGIEPMDAAWGVHEIATLDMEHAVRLVSINRGFDPREHALVCTGGAAGAHASRLARALGCTLAIVPVAASGGSARGLLEADFSSEVTRTAVVCLDDDATSETPAQMIEELLEQADRGWSGAHNGSVARVTLGMRYLGQGHELLVPIEPGLRSPTAIAERFHQRYERIYGYRDDRPVEIATWQVTLIRPNTQPPRFQRGDASDLSARPARRTAYFPETGAIEVDVHPRDALAPGATLAGPCLVSEPTTTTVVLPGDQAEVAADGSLLIQIGAR